MLRKDEYPKQRTKDNYVQILRFFLSIPASAADAAAVIPKEIKTLLANGLITFFIDGKIVILFLVMDQVIYQEILLIASS